MLTQNTSHNSDRPVSEPERGRPAPRGRGRRPIHSAPKPLLRLGPGDCRYCVDDAPEGCMDQALFCAAPVQAGVYCLAHRRRCIAAPISLEALTAEVEAALAPRR